MQLLSDYKSISDLPNAIILVGDREAGLTELTTFVSKNGGIQIGDSDLFIFSTSALSVDQCRDEITPQVFRKPTGTRKMVCVSASHYGEEAQTSLLKTLEESFGACIILLAENEESLLTTVRSRCTTLSIAGAGEARGRAIELSKKFLQSSVVERLRLLEPLCAKIEGDSERAKAEKRLQKETARLFAQELAVALHNNKKVTARGGEAIILANRLLDTPAPNLKLILDHLAFTIPTSKTPNK